MCAYICYTVYVNGHSVQWGENGFEIAFLQVNILEKLKNPFCSVCLERVGFPELSKFETFFFRQDGMNISEKIDEKKMKMLLQKYLTPLFGGL